MVQFHKLAAVGLAVTLSSIGNVFALGLGEVTWKSTLNQPLDAEIAVYDAHNISNKELIVKIASDEDFAKAGIERPYALTNLVFTPVLNNGKGIIKITSSQPIKEPYLDFLLSVSWSSGQTLREYTLLIDPPAYVPPTVTPAAPTKKTVQPPVGKPSKKATPAVIAENKSAPKKSRPTAKPIKEGGTVKAFRGSSLWLLAERSRGNTSVQQAMLAIYEENPDAFLDGKMSLLKEGAVLRIPTREQMRKASRADAESQVLANVNGTATTAQRQMIASKVEQKAPANKVIQDQLKLAGVSNDDLADKKDLTQKSMIADLTTQVAQSSEELDATRSKNNELRSRLSDLQSRLADMKKLIELKDNQLAALQANIEKQHQETAVDSNTELPAKTEEKKTL